MTPLPLNEVIILVLILGTFMVALAIDNAGKE
jgi:hypothetical protein